MAVIAIVRFFDILTVSNSAELKSFLQTTFIPAPESTTNFLSSGSFVHAASSTHSSESEQNVALSFSSSLYLFLARFHDLPRAHRCCLAVSSWRSVLNFHSVGTSLMRNFDLNFTKRWTFIFSDVCLTQCSLRESYSSKLVPTLFVPFREIAADSGGSVSCDTQLNCRTLFTTATALLSSSFFGFLFGCSSTFQCGNEHSAPNLQPESDLENGHSGGCQ